MARKKVELKYITNESARKNTFIKRKKGLIKKITELSILCDVPACLVMYSQYETNPVVWPNDLEARRIIAEYKNMPEIEQSKRMVNQETFLKERIAKLKEKLRKLRKENDEKELSLDMFQCLVGRPLQGLSVVGMSNMRALLERSERDINAKLNRMREGAAQGNLQAPPQTPAVVPPASVVTGGDPNMNANVH